jgi:uncharacterized coiled-coil DUF342 family protein/GT2 family glycosyltransferase/glycosyltransferase involved in cell wall biosynthesis
MIDINDWPSPDKEKLFKYLRLHSYRSERHRLFYVATPKVACTTLTWWFANMEGYTQALRQVTDSAETDPDLVIHDAFHKVAPNVTGLMPEALSEALTSDSFFRFAVVRNPYKRIFSAWQSKLLLQEPQQIGPYLECDFFRRPIECAEDIATAFEGFLEHLATNEAPSYWDVHWTPQATLLRPDLINYSKLVKIENAAELSQALAERSGGYIPDPFANRRTNESLIPYLPELVTARSSELIRSLYAIDFETFGYGKQPPEAKETFSSDQFDLALKAITFIRARHQRLGERTEQIVSLVSERNGLAAERDSLVSERNGLAAERDSLVSERNGLAAERDSLVSERNGLVAERDSLVSERNGLVAERDHLVSERNGLVAERDQLVSERNGLVAERDHLVSERNGLVAERDQLVSERNGLVAERDHLVSERNGLVAERDGLVADRDQIFNSTSWKITKPLRFIRQNVNKLFLKLKWNGKVCADPNHLWPLNVIHYKMNVKITVAICTFKRYPLMRGLIVKLAEQTVSPSAFEILVVDNNDDEHERELFAKEFMGRPGLEVVTSSPPGLSRARNMAIEKCRTEFIVFIDDDALPDPVWLDSLLAAFSKSGASVIAGPIAPVWPRARPDWIPEKYVGCLTILDYGSEDRFLSDYEFAYGTNMAFRLSALRETGGFNVALGRTGNRTLISDEEVEIQTALCARGHKVFYAATAKVNHTVHENRITRNYFRARMAWQAVSVLLHEPPAWHPVHSSRELARASRALGLENMLSQLFSSQDATTFSAQIDLIYHLFFLVLNANGVSDDAFEKQFAAAPKPKNVAAPKPENVNIAPVADDSSGSPLPYAYHPTAVIGSNTRHLFVEGQSGHAFLFDVYGGLPDSQLLKLKVNTWNKCDAALHYVEESLSPQLQTLTFLSLESLVYGPSSPALLDLLSRLEIPAFGFLHRPPYNPKHASTLREVATWMKSIIVLSEDMASRLKTEYGIENVTYLPHHPVHFQYAGKDRHAIRERLGIRPDQVVFSVIGEARKGKGIDLLLSALGYLTESDRDRMYFLFGGRAKDFDAGTVENKLATTHCHGYVDLRRSADPLHFAVLTEREFGQYVAVTDIGIQLYQEDQRDCMSGVLPDYVWGHIPVIATEDSIVGKLVLKYGLGNTLAMETPEEVAKALGSALHANRKTWVQTLAYDAFRKSIAPEAVVDAIANILNTSLSSKT